jgi:penicillin-binding protein 1A
MVTRLMALVKGLWHSLLPPVFRLASDALLRFTRGIGSTVRQVRDYDWRRAKLRDFRFLWRYAKLAAVLVLIAGAAFYLSVYFGLFGRMPSVSALKALQNHTASEVYSADSVLLGRYYIQDRTHVPYEKISPDVIKALVATEDVRFYEHSGVDPRSLARVVVKTLLLQRESSGGGSTISQQLAKNLYPRRKYRLVGTSINKLQEMIIARRLESIYSKPQILELYLNTVPMGDLFGIERAAERFFSTDAGKLSTEQAAVLVGMLKANTSYNPKLNPERSKQRRNVVLGQMAKYGYLEPSRADSLKQVPIKLRYRYENHNDGLAPYFREQLRKELAAWCARIQKPDGSPYNLYTDGLRIYTTIHSKMQAHAEQAVRVKMAALQQSFNSHWKGRDPWDSDEVLLSAMRQTPRYRELREDGLSEEEILEDFRKPLPMQVFSWKGEFKKNLTPWDSLRYYQRFLNTGLISMEPRTGYVRAWVGGIDHEYFKYDHVRAKRQAGSTFKPVVYAAALEQGIEPCTYFPNTRDTYAQYDNWSPRNADGHYGGEYSMRGALAHSVNTVSAKIIVQAGIGETIHLARRLGIQSDLPEIPGLALGVAEISLMEMVSAYTTFISNGYQTPAVYITSIVDRTGKVLRQHQPRENRKQVISYANADVMIALLQGVVEEGSAARLRSEFGLSMDIAGKTGTTQNHADGWFIGITPELVTGVWVGAESPTVHFRTLSLGQGAATALPVWADFMARLGRDRAFRTVASSRFRPLPPHLQARLQCESFLDDAPVEEETEDFSLGGLVDKIFGNRTKDEQTQERTRQEQHVKQRRREEEKQRREEERRQRKERRRERRERNN